MKTLRVVVLACLCVSARGELLFETFDRLAEGPITNVPGWTSRFGPWTNSIPGVVTNLAVYSPPRALDLPVPPGGVITNTAAVYTNFQYRYVAGSNSPLVRLSAMLYLASTSRDLYVGLGDRTNLFLRVTQDHADGTVLVNSLDTGAVLPTGRLTSLTVYFNMSNRQVAADGPTNNILPWTDSGLSGGATQFNAVALGRYWKTGASGRVAFDNVVFETFPPYVLGWWRMGDGMEWTEADQTGRFALTNGYWWSRYPAASEPVYDGWGDVRNLHSVSAPSFNPFTSRLGPVVLSNWTVEVVHQFTSPSVQNCDFFSWGSTNYLNTDSYIHIWWSDSLNQLTCMLRDLAAGGSSAYVYSPVLDPDLQWHHLAFVKRDDRLLFYGDYELMADEAISSHGDGNYSFPTGSIAAIGIALNNAQPAQTNNLFDEVRVSDRALEPGQFLLPSRPILEKVPMAPNTTNWVIEVQTISGKVYRVYGGTNLLGGSWGFITNFTARGLWSVFTTAPPAQAFSVLRVWRDP